MKKILEVIKENECVHCKTLEEAKEYCKLCHEQGLTWCDGKFYINKNHWYSEYTAYYPHRGTYSNVVFKKDAITFEEFKKRLKEIDMEEMIYNIPEGYEFDSVENGVIKLKKKGFPKTIEECKELLQEQGKYNNLLSKVSDLSLIYLLMAREVYRNGWEPDWTSSEPKHVICFSKGVLNKNEGYYINRILSFQSEEVRDAFFENFKELIEEAKELI